ncbi:tetratricopeptide repeat protein [Ferrimonas sediminicola]|nr:tetratricopeptide repeat protein [Ferrimonas sediminicola]
MRDKRPVALAVLLSAAMIILTLEHLVSPPLSPAAEAADPAPSPQSYVSGALNGSEHARQQQQRLRLKRFEEAVQLMTLGHLEGALVAWHRFIADNPTVAEAQVNLGFTLIGLLRWPEAGAAFEHALEMNPDQANAYYGLALVLEQRQQLAAAIGHMRTYLHLRRDDQFASRARAALWLWETQLSDATHDAEPGSSSESPASAAPAPASSAG